MKKLIYILGFAITLLLVHNVLKSPFDDAIVVSKSKLEFESSKMTVYLIAMDYIKEEEKIKGKYYIALADGKKIIDRQEVIYFHEFWINNKEKLIFQDIDEDGTYECFLGFENPYDDSEMNYLGFQVSDNKVRKLEFEEDIIISSSKELDEDGFDILEKGLFYSYDRNPDIGDNTYVFTKYQIDGNEVESRSKMKFEGNPEDEDIDNVEKIMERLYKINYNISKKALIENEESLYFDIEENYKLINLYQYINDDSDKFYGDNYHKLYEIIDNIENPQLQFADLSIEKIRDITYGEFVSIENEERDFVKEEKKINGFTLVYGGFHLDSYIILFDTEGNYLDSLVWTDKCRNDVRVIIKGDKIFIYPRIKNDMFYYAKTMLELSINKGRLVKESSKVISLDCCPDPIYGYTYSMCALEDLESLINARVKVKFTIKLDNSEFSKNVVLDSKDISYEEFNWKFYNKTYLNYVNDIMMDIISENRNAIIDSIPYASEEKLFDYINLLNILRKSCDDIELESILIEKINGVDKGEYEEKLIEKIVNGGK